jgi:cytochrome c-type biogenesis protein CcmF
MDYIGEHRLPGQIGHFLIILSLVASLVATFSYFMATKERADVNGNYWKKLARYAFITECFSVFSAFILLFYLISGHYFEYEYVWKHSSMDLEPKYLLSCFWEGQEGSFLLWSVWHCVLGLILIRTGRQWEAPVMTVISFAQFCLATMILGVYVFGHKIGSNPFLLLREAGLLDTPEASGFHVDQDISKPLLNNYATLLTDGRGLNKLLQNYWMVIHPPVLFLGFASTIVPMAFAIAGLWTKKFGEWTGPALPWSLFATAVLGVGIMMGAKWAYESLNFGGYWAWDPVENASLVPWLILVAGLHTLLIYKHTGHSLRATHLFLILSFLFIVYSTFLTRSGVLQNQSVHAFTDLGMNVQLLTFLLIFVIPSLVLFLVRYKEIPAIRKEESTSSREFWMFIGSLVFFLSALVIIGKTSLPAFFNKAAPEDAEFAYNQIQIFVAIILAVLTGFTQYLKYKSTPSKFFWKKLWLPALISLIAGTMVLMFGDIDYTKQGPGFLGAIWMAVVCSIFTVVANAAYIWLGIKGNLKLSGGSVSHVGFGLVLVGILISSSKKEILSYNTSGIPIPFAKESGQKTGENLTLIKGLKGDMGKYWVTYEKSTKLPQEEKWSYDIRFQKKDGKEEFTLIPTAYVGRDGITAEPDSRHYWDHDVFTYVTSLSREQASDTSAFQIQTLKPGDSLFYTKGFIIFKDVITKDSLPEHLFGPNGSLHEASLKVHSQTGSTYSISPKLAFAKGDFLAVPDTILQENLVLQLRKVNPDKSIELGMKESSVPLDFLTLKAYKFPMINVLWAGIIITAIGILMSMVRRIRLNRLRPE